MNPTNSLLKIVGQVGKDFKVVKDIKDVKVFKEFARSFRLNTRVGFFGGNATSRFDHHKAQTAQIQ